MINRKLRRLLVFAAVCAGAFCLTACSWGKNEYIPDDSIRIYRADMSYSSLTWEYYVLKAKDMEGSIAEVMAKLSSKPSNSTYNKVVPDDVEILDWHLAENGRLVVNFSEKYIAMDTLTEIFCRAGVVKTLCGIDGVESVEFMVNGNPLVNAGDINAGSMSDDDFIDNTGENVFFRQSVNLTVYYADNSGGMMSEAHLIIESNGTRSLEALAMEQLINGPAFETDKMQAALPEGTEIKSIITRDGICYVDLSSEFLDGKEGIDEEVTVYSIVNTLTGLPSITRVQITIEGKPEKSLGKVQIGGFLEYRPELIANERSGDKSE